MKKNWFFILVSFVFCSAFASDPDPINFQTFLQVIGVPLVGGKLDCSAKVPIRKVKIDIGLSYNAPHSQAWLSQEPDLLVFGFEPNLFSVNAIKGGAKKRNAIHGTPLEVKYLTNGQMRLIPCALSNRQAVLDLYVTRDDHGCSSIYPPTVLEVETTMKVPVYTLKDFFDLFPFDQYPYIEYIKTDAQGSDLDIIKGAGSYLKERVVYVTIEPENYHYRGTDNSVESIRAFMEESGFIQVFDQDTCDPTFLNKRFIGHPCLQSIQCFQRG